MRNNLNHLITKQIVRNILAHKDAESIVVFGSRANGEAKRASDIDIAVFGRNWNDTDINITRDRLNETIKTPLKFDLVSFHLLKKKSLRTSILKEGKTIYENKKNRRNRK